jgi:MFS transporter, DHA2 family, multidrug resistance protein
MPSGGNRRWWAIGALALVLLAFGVDGTVLNLALPVLATDLHASSGDLQWFVDAYSLVIAAMLLPAGLLGDRFGRKRMLLVALVVFGLASAGCAYAQSAGELIVLRALLGLGAAFLVPLCMSVLPVMFDEQERPKAVSALTGATVLAFPLGPILGGWMLQNFWWGSVFLINVPVVIVAGIAVVVLLPESRNSLRPRIDLGGIVLSSLGLSGLTYGVIEAGQHGWGDPAALAPLVIGAFLLALFAAWERRIATGGGQPLVESSLFRSAGFTWGTILATLASFAMYGLLFAVPQFSEAVEGKDTLGAGLRLLPLLGGILVGGGAATRITPRIGTKATAALGFAAMAAAMVLGAATTAGSGDGFVESWVALVGAGLGFALPTAMDAALGALSDERAGVGSSLIQAVRQVGGTFGVAILGSIISSAYRARLDVGTLPPPAAEAARAGVSSAIVIARRTGSSALLDSARAAFVHGMDLTLWVCGSIALTGVVLALAFLPRGRGGKAAAPHDAGVEAADDVNAPAIAGEQPARA